MSFDCYTANISLLHLAKQYFGGHFLPNLLYLHWCTFYCYIFNLSWMYFQLFNNTLVKSVFDVKTVQCLNVKAVCANNEFQQLFESFWNCCHSTVSFAENNPFLHKVICKRLGLAKKLLKERSLDLNVIMIMKRKASRERWLDYNLAERSKTFNWFQHQRARLKPRNDQ